MSPERNHADSETEDTSEGDGTTVTDDKSEAEKKDETQHEQLTRNFNELLQELRVTQTGVQILTGFLLTLPFTERFADLDNVQKFAYLAVLCGSVIATGLIIGPVAFHRILFRQGERRWLVHAANQAARAGLLMLALTTSGVVWLVFDLVTNRTAANVAGSLALIFFAGLWAGVPVISRRR
jgi:thiosulfate reductase cytochrome b subunit